MPRTRKTQTKEELRIAVLKKQINEQYDRISNLENELKTTRAHEKSWRVQLGRATSQIRQAADILASLSAVHMDSDCKILDPLVYILVELAYVHAANAKNVCIVNRRNSDEQEAEKDD